MYLSQPAQPSLPTAVLQGEDKDAQAALENWLATQPLHPGETSELMWFIHLERISQLMHLLNDEQLEHERRAICLHYAFKPLLALREQANSEIQKSYVNELMMNLMAKGRYLHRQC